MIFGMIMISSVSVYDSYRITRQQVELGLTDEPYNSFFVFRNILHVLVGSALFAMIVKTPYQLIERYIRPIFGITLIMMVFVLFFGVEINGAKGWFDIPGVPFLLQPTEFLKLTLILYLAYLFKIKRHSMHEVQ